MSRWKIWLELIVIAGPAILFLLIGVLSVFYLFIGEAIRQRRCKMSCNCKNGCSCGGKCGNTCERIIVDEIDEIDEIDDTNSQEE